MKDVGNVPVVGYRHIINIYTYMFMYTQVNKPNFIDAEIKFVYVCTCTFVCKYIARKQSHVNTLLFCIN